MKWREKGKGWEKVERGRRGRRRSEEGRTCRKGREGGWEEGRNGGMETKSSREGRTKLVQNGNRGKAR